MASSFDARRVIIVALVILIGATILTFFAPRLLTASGPTQPIAFSHKIHAGDRQIPCAYCHRYAAESTAAGIPSVEVCAGCHRVVKPADPQVQAVMTYWNNQEAIPWEAVYRVPDFVYFSHEMHISAGVGCESCHGNVASTDQMAKAQPLSMGWCLSCHSQKGASTDCWTCHK